MNMKTLYVETVTESITLQKEMRNQGYKILSLHVNQTTKSGKRMIAIVVCK